MMKIEEENYQNSLKKALMNTQKVDNLITNNKKHENAQNFTS